MDTEARVRSSFADQANACVKLGSPFMGILLSGLGEKLDRSTKTGQAVLDWEGDPEPEKDALALRVAGGLHALVRRGDCPLLSQYYQNPECAEEPEFMSAVLSTITEHDAKMLTWLEYAPQTNEVGRSAIVYAGLCAVVRRFDLPVNLYEIGSSGGLNLQVGEYGYIFGGRRFGNVHSALQLEPCWSGELPPNVKVNVVNRRGCDLNPLSVENGQDSEKLIGYLWPDQPKRIERAQAAIEIARNDPPKVDCRDAALWVEEMFSDVSSEGRLSVLFHTIAWNYFPNATKDRITNTVQIAGSRATHESPLAWLSFEFADKIRPELILRSWPGNTMQVLASADPHVHSINWL